MTDLIRVPWTSEQVDALTRFQQEGGMHPFTCGALHTGGQSPVLDATHSGWICPDPACDYTQDWAHAFMAEPSAWPRFPFGERQRADRAEAALARVREVAARIRQGAPWTANHDGIADRIEAALKESTPFAADDLLHGEPAAPAQAATEREQRLVDAHQATIGQLRAAEARVRALEAETALLCRYRPWLADQLAAAETRDQVTGAVPAELRISPHNGIASGLRTALYGLDHILDHRPGEEQ